jgi:2-amino-4-hydroxy-6-hydroxymethyldihydropteridine pyrophosphokinase
VVKTVYLSLGSNIGDREEMLQSAVDRLQAPDLRIRRISPVYETEPMDYKDQRAFLNLVVEAETDLFPLRLLARLQKLEIQLGRKRTGPPKGPRSIDIDILLYGRFTVHSARLEIPHPRMHERRFVLAPLFDLAPDLRHPTLCRTIRDLLTSVEGQKVRRLDSSHISLDRSRSGV